MIIHILLFLIFSKLYQFRIILSLNNRTANVDFRVKMFKTGDEHQGPIAYSESQRSFSDLPVDNAFG